MLKKLDADRLEWDASETKFKEIEGLIRQTENLEISRRDLERQLTGRTGDLQARRDEKLLCQTRIEARKQVEKDHDNAVKEVAAAKLESDQRSATATRCLENDKLVAPAQQQVDDLDNQIGVKKKRVDELRTAIVNLRNQQRDWRAHAGLIAAELQKLTLSEQLTAARRQAESADAEAEEIARLEKYIVERAAPSDQALTKLKADWQRSLELRATLDASSMSLKLTLVPGGSAAQLAVDGAPTRAVTPMGETIQYAVRRNAELLIDGWGQLELKRGVGSEKLDDVETELRKCQDDFVNAVAPFGLAATDPNALQYVMDLSAEHRLRTYELIKKKKALKKSVPDGVPALHAKVVELQTKIASASTPVPLEHEPLPTERAELDKLATALAKQIDTLERDIDKSESACTIAEAESISVQRDATAAKEALAACKATAGAGHEELARLKTEAEITLRVESAGRALEEAGTRLAQSELTEAERTIDFRLNAAEEAVQAVDRQIRENSENLSRIKGRMEGSEGLHSQRAALAARVDELTRATERELLEKDAVDRLYGLFEECRERQLGTLMGPIHDRVLNWMRILDIGDYKAIRFNDAFLPESLVRRDETAEFALDEESTGAQEQIAMLVRLALGSILASAAEPAIAILDDPLTHCDVGRLSRMRAILHRAAARRSNGPRPPSGRCRS